MAYDLTRVALLDACHAQAPALGQGGPRQIQQPGNAGELHQLECAWRTVEDGRQPGYRRQHMWNNAQRAADGRGKTHASARRQAGGNGVKRPGTGSDDHNKRR